tara:strand:+ start:523 stop:975 length:453 start_codon:yes stop_codon:yes gene_type:complete
MAISQVTCDSYLSELLKGIHAFGTTVVRAGTTADVFKIALYSSTATLDSSTTVYSTTDEISGTGYVAGGEILTISPAPAVASNTAFLSFSDAVWTSASFTAAGALIYNSSQGNKAVAVLSFGSNKTVVNQPFTIVFPAADYTNAIIRVGR